MKHSWFFVTTQDTVLGSEQDDIVILVQGCVFLKLSMVGRTSKLPTSSLILHGDLAVSVHLVNPVPRRIGSSINFALSCPCLSWRPWVYDTKTFAD